MDRRKFVKAVGVASSAMAISFSGRSVSAQKNPLTGKKPNIILILVDDMGFADIGCYGSEIETPNLDRLAREGLRFRQFYNCSRCCPTRASILTGLYPHQTGIGDMVNPGFDFGKPGYRGRLNRQCVTIAEVLGSTGYHTFMSGKWHLSQDPDCLPNDRGFEEYYGLLYGAGNYFKPKGLMRNRDEINPEDLPLDYYTTDAFTDMALEFIKKYQPDGKPFFLYLAYNAPHWPLHAKPEDIEKYQGKYLKGWDVLRQERYERQIGLKIIDRKWRLSERDPKVPAWDDISEELKIKTALKMSVYAGMIDCIDQNIGKLVQCLGNMGILDNTLIMFLSDNGACWETGAFGFDWNIKYSLQKYKELNEIGTAKSFVSYGRCWSNAGNTPFRLHKHWVHEGGISTPLIAYWPSGITEKGKISEEIGHVVDIMATCLDVSGAEYPEAFKGNQILPLEGKSLAPVFADKKREGHEFIGWEHEGNRAILKDNWKLVSAYPDEWELYDLEDDRTETNNLAKNHPLKRIEMEKLYQEWARSHWVEPWNPVNKYWPWIKGTIKPG